MPDRAVAVDPRSYNVPGSTIRSVQAGEMAFNVEPGRPRRDKKEKIVKKEEPGTVWDVPTGKSGPRVRRSDEPSRRRRRRRRLVLIPIGVRLSLMLTITTIVVVTFLPLGWQSSRLPERQPDGWGHGEPRRPLRR